MATETTQSESAVNESVDEKKEGLSVEKTLDEVDALRPLDNSPVSDSKDMEILKEAETPDMKENGTPKEQILQNDRIVTEKPWEESDVSKTVDNSPISDLKDKEALKEEETPEVKEIEAPKEQETLEGAINETLEKQETPEIEDTKIPKEMAINETLEKQEIPDIEETKIPMEINEIMEKQETIEVEETKTPKEADSIEVAETEIPKKQDYLEAEETKIPKEQDYLEAEETKIPKEINKTLEKQETIEAEETKTPKEADSVEVAETEIPKEQDYLEAKETKTPKEEDYLEDEETKIPKEHNSLGVKEDNTLKDLEPNKGTMEESLKQEAEVTPDVTEESSAMKQETLEATKEEIPKKEDIPKIAEKENTNELETYKDQLPAETVNENASKVVEEEKLSKEPNKGAIEESLKEEAEVTPDLTEESSAMKQETLEATKEETPKEEDIPKISEKENTNELETYKDQLPAETVNEHASKVVEEEKLSKEASESAEADREKEVKLAEDREIPIPTVEHKSGAGGEENNTENVPTTVVHKGKDGAKLSLRRSTEIFRNVGSKMLQVMQKMKNTITRKSSNEKATKQAR